MESPKYRSPSPSFEEHDNDYKCQLDIAIINKSDYNAILKHFMGNRIIQQDVIPSMVVQRWFIENGNSLATSLTDFIHHPPHLILNNIQTSLNMRIVNGSGGISSDQTEYWSFYLTNETPRRFKSSHRFGGGTNYAMLNPWNSVLFPRTSNIDSFVATF